MKFLINAIKFIDLTTYSPLNSIFMNFNHRKISIAIIPSIFLLWTPLPLVNKLEDDPRK
jgi:hypothetical protein